MVDVYTRPLKAAPHTIAIGQIVYYDRSFAGMSTPGLLGVVSDIETGGRLTTVHFRYNGIWDRQSKILPMELQIVGWLDSSELNMLEFPA